MWVDKKIYDSLTSFHQERRFLPIGIRIQYLIDMSKIKYPIRLKTKYSHRRSRKHKFKSCICMVCEKNQAACQHHIVLLVNGGPDTSWNRITICFDCHKKIHPWLSNPVRLGNGFI